MGHIFGNQLTEQVSQLIIGLSLIIDSLITESRRPLHDAVRFI